MIGEDARGPAALVRWLPLTAGVIWGTAFPAISFALESFSPLALAFWRAVLGSGSLGLWLLARGSLRIPRSASGWVRMGVISLAGTGLFWPTQSIAVDLSNSTNVAFLVALYPVLVAAGAPLILGEGVRGRTIAGLIVALAGAYLVISQGRLLTFFTGEGFLGDGLALFAALSFSAYIILGRLWRSRIGVPAEVLTFYTFALSLPVLAAISLATGPLVPLVQDFELSALGGLLWLGLVASTGAFLALNFGVRHGVVARSAVHLMIIPLVAAVLGWVFFRINLEPVQWVGGTLILAGIAATTEVRRT